MSQLLTELNTPIIKTERECTINFKTVITQAIDETLSSLGKDVKQAFYINLEKNFELRKEEICLNLKSFTEALEFIFDKSSLLIEIKIMKNLHQKVNTFEYETNKSEICFLDYTLALQKFVEC